MKFGPIPTMGLPEISLGPTELAALVVVERRVGKPVTLLFSISK
jgi:hypothetical protein